MNDTFSLARNTRGIAQHDAEPQIDIRRMRAWRLGRIQGELRRLDLGGIILYDPVNIRYATGTSNMQILVKEDGIELLSDMPFETALL